MLALSPCGDTDEHDAHNYEVEAEVICTGMAICGARAHEPHWIREDQPYRCPGVCLCGSQRMGVHGPGEHK